MLGCSVALGCLTAAGAESVKSESRRDHKTHDFFYDVRYPAHMRSDVGRDKIIEGNDGGAGEYHRRVVEWWPKRGMDVVPLEDIPGAPLRTWTVRTPELAPLVEAGYYAKWWPADLKGKKQFEAHLIGFRGVGSRVGDPFADKAKVLALGKGICPAVVLRLPDGRKRCFTRGSFSDEDQAYIIDLYDREMDRIRGTLEPPPTGRRPHVVNMPVAKLNTPGMYRESSDRWVITSGSQEADDGIPGTWINAAQPELAAVFRKSTFRCFEDYWAYLEYAGHKMPCWEWADEHFQYLITWGGTRLNGGKPEGRGNGGGYACCSTACWEGLYHEWGHGTANSGRHMSIGWGETVCDALQTVADPTLVRKVMFGVQRPYKNPFRGHYPGGFGYIMMSDDPNWGYAATVTFTDLVSPAEKTPMHAIARLGQDRGIWKNGVRGVGDFMAQIGARMAEYDYEIESTMREAYPQHNRAFLVAIDRSKGLYRSTRTEAPEPFGNNIVQLVAEPGARELTVDFQGIFDPDTYSDWRACIVAVGANGRPRYSPLWSKGRMSMAILPGDKRFWLTVTATPYALCRGGGSAHGIYDGGFTYKYPYEVQLTGCRPGNPNAPIGVCENMELIGPALIARADYTERHCGKGDWPHPSDTPEYEEMKRTLETVAAKGPVMMKRFLAEKDLFTRCRFCPIMGGNASHIKSVASAAFLEWRAKWLLENALGARHPKGGGWVARSARVAPTAYVGPDCMVLDGAQVLDNAIIEEYAMVSGPKVLIKDNARVYGKAVVCGDVTLSGHARVMRTIHNRESTVRLLAFAPGYAFQVATGAEVTRDGPEERVEVYKHAGYKLQANYAFDRPETVLLEDWYQEHSVGGSEFGAHSEDLVFYDGLLYGRPGFEKDGDVRAFTFNGKDQYAEAEGSMADLGAITVDARLKPAIGRKQTVFDFGSSVTNRFMLTIEPSGRPAVITVKNGKARQILASKPLKGGEWASCRVEIDGSRIRLWLDNGKVAETESAFRAADAFPGGAEKRNFIAATRDGKDFFKGSIDHLRVYFTVYDDFARAPEPPVVASRRIAPEFVERFDKAYAGYSDKESAFRAAWSTNETRLFYKEWARRVENRMEELQRSDEISALEKRLQSLEAELGKRKHELGVGFDQDPKNVEKRKQRDELERQRRARFEELRDTNAEITALRKQAEEARKTREELSRKDPNDPRIRQAGDTEREAHDKLRQIEGRIWRAPPVVALEKESRKLDTGRERDMYIEGRTGESATEIGNLKREIEALRLKTALSRSDEYLALKSLDRISNQYDQALEELMRSLLLPPMSENRDQLTSSLERQQEPWHTRVDWDRRTRWELPGEELQPMMKKWLARQRGPVISVDQAVGQPSGIGRSPER